MYFMGWRRFELYWFERRKGRGAGYYHIFSFAQDNDAVVHDFRGKDQSTVFCGAAAIFNDVIWWKTLTNRWEPERLYFEIWSTTNFIPDLARAIEQNGGQKSHIAGEIWNKNAACI